MDNADIRKELAELKEQTEDRFQVVFEALDQILSDNGDKNSMTENTNMLDAECLKDLKGEEKP